MAINQHDRKALIVDDIPLMPEIIKTFLLEMGYKEENITVVQDADQARVEIPKMLVVPPGTEPNIIITDKDYLDPSFPDADGSKLIDTGLRLLTEARDNPHAKGIGRVLMTGDDNMTGEKASKFGADGFIPKHNDHDTMDKTITAVIIRRAIKSAEEAGRDRLLGVQHQVNGPRSLTEFIAALSKAAELGK